ncbi:MAG: hypothetical protein LH629_13890 [Ignavibacteria bacterium]|nr:hypothetical protein [Ignavibacteria bacterium]
MFSAIFTEGDSNSRERPSFAKPTIKLEFKTATLKYFSGVGLLHPVKINANKNILFKVNFLIIF